MPIAVPQSQRTPVIFQQTNTIISDDWSDGPIAEITNESSWDGRLVRIRFKADAAFLTLVLEGKVGETWSTLLEDADFDTPSSFLPWTSKTSAGPSVHLTPADTYAEIAIDPRGLSGLRLSATTDGAQNGEVSVCVS